METSPRISTPPRVTWDPWDLLREELEERSCRRVTFEDECLSLNCSQDFEDTFYQPIRPRSRDFTPQYSHAGTESTLDMAHGLSTNPFRQTLSLGQGTAGSTNPFTQTLHVTTGAHSAQQPTLLPQPPVHTQARLIHSTYNTMQPSTLPSQSYTYIQPQLVQSAYNPFVGKEQKPPLFNGTCNEKWEQFISCFEKVAYFNNWDSTAKCSRLLISLRGEAVEFVDNLTYGQTRDYAELKRALAQRYGEIHNTQIHESQFYARRRNEHESLDQYLKALQYLADKAFPQENGSLYYRLISHQFVQGLADHLLRNQLLWELNRSRATGVELLNEVLAFAQNYESIYGSTHVQRKTEYNAESLPRTYMYSEHAYGYENTYMTQDTSLPQNANMYDTRQEPVAQYPYRPPSDVDPDREVRPIICRNCQGQGHMASNCPERQGNEAPLY